MKPEFAELVASRYERLRHAAFVLCGDLDAADDLVQTALARAVRARSRLEAARDLDAYLYVLLVNTYRTGLRRMWRGETSVGLNPTVGYQRSADDEVDRRLDVRRALMRLTPDHRRVLVLRFMADLSEEATADALGCSIGTVKSRTSRALSVLRVDHAAQQALAKGER